MLVFLDLAKSKHFHLSYSKRKKTYRNSTEIRASGGYKPVIGKDIYVYMRDSPLKKTSISIQSEVNIQHVFFRIPNEMIPLLEGISQHILQRQVNKKSPGVPVFFLVLELLLRSFKIH